MDAPLLNRAHLILAILSLPLLSLAQPEESLASWSDISYQLGFKTTWGITAEAGARGMVTDPDWRALYFNPKFIYRNTDQLNLSAAFGVWQNFYSQSPNSTELRATQDVNLTAPDLENISLKTRIRLEERYFISSSDTNLGGSQVSPWKFRTRVEAKLRTRDFDFGKAFSEVYFFSSGEYFIPLSGDATEFYADQTRLAFGYGQNFKGKSSYELHFIWQRTKSDSEAEFNSQQYILRLRIFIRNNKRIFTEE